MARSTQLSVVQPAAEAINAFSPAQVQLIKDQIAPTLTDAELALFIEVCKRNHLDPFRKQVYAIKRWNKALGREVMTIQTSIDGFRLIAERAGRFVGREGPLWCGPDGKWVDVWLESKPPAAAKVGVVKIVPDGRATTWAVATWAEYAQTTKEGGPAGLWRQMPAHMLGKVAESLALRASFPDQLSGLYSDEEMAQADATPASALPTPQDIAPDPKIDAQEIAALIDLAASLPEPRDDKAVQALVARTGFQAALGRIVKEHARQCGEGCGHLAGELV